MEKTLFEFYNSKESPLCFHNIFGTVEKEKFIVSFNFSFWIDKTFLPKDCFIGQVFGIGDHRNTGSWDKVFGKFW